MTVTSGPPEDDHANLRTNEAVTRADLLALGPDDVVFEGLPLFPCFGQSMNLKASPPAAIGKADCLGAPPGPVARPAARRCLRWYRDGYSILVAVDELCYCHLSRIAGLDGLPPVVHAVTAEAILGSLEASDRGSAGAVLAKK